jgi:hypothetical protein
MVNIANIIHSAKSGSDWSGSELMAYRITVSLVPPQQFFGPTHDPPLTGFDPALIDSPLSIDGSAVSRLLSCRCYQCH